MKVTTSLSAMCLFIFTVITSPSCKKIIDEIKKNPSNGVASDCRIHKIIGVLGGGGQDTAYFSYNKAGNPTRIQHSSNDWYLGGNSRHGISIDMVFKYDNQNRLIAVLRSYYRDTILNRDVAEFWETYTYDTNDMIRKKSYFAASASFSAGDAYNTIKNSPEFYSEEDGITESIIKLDEFGRIKEINGSNFNYDTNGNKVGYGFIYGDKISYYQTNKVWMFIKNNYSINMKTEPLDFYENDEFPSAYNSKKLPTKFNRYPTLTNIRIYSALTQAATIEYVCK